MSSFRLLDKFRGTFASVCYRHRSSKLGDLIALELYEDLYAIRRSALYNQRVDERRVGINSGNLRRGVKARRGDGTFGELVPGADPVIDPGFSVARGHVATVEIGVEVKIMSKAMVRQVDRVRTDILGQSREFRRKRDRPAFVALVGINHAERYISFEGDRRWETTGTGKYLHPYQEAKTVEATLREGLAGLDHLLFLRFRATNYDPFKFEWLDEAGTLHDYGAMLARIARDYDERFGRRGAP